MLEKLKLNNHFIEIKVFKFFSENISKTVILELLPYSKIHLKNKKLEKLAQFICFGKQENLRKVMFYNAFKIINI